jgi:nucleoside-diphosphate-sugar epimerase
VRTALDGSVAQDHWMNREIRYVTVLGGTGFIGRRVAHHLRGSGVTSEAANGMDQPDRVVGRGLSQSGERPER